MNSTNIDVKMGRVMHILGTVRFFRLWRSIEEKIINVGWLKL
jgi:hypothetical protein